VKKFLILAIVLIVAVSLVATPAVAGKHGQAGKSNVAHVYLYEKNVTPPNDDWSIVAGGAWGELKFNLMGSTFDYVFNGHGLMPNTGYSLIYYADPWPGDGITHSTGALIASGTSNTGGNIHLNGSVELNTDLPNPDDNNYTCPGGDPATPGSPPTPFPCPGAKIWLVLSDDYDAANTKMTGWNPSEYLFENMLISYDDTDWCVVEGTVGTGWSDTAVNCAFALIAKYGDADASSTVPGDDGGCYPELAVQGGIPDKNVLATEQFGWVDEQFYQFRAEYDGGQTASITLNGVKAEATSDEILDPTSGEMSITVKTTDKWQEPGTKVVVRNLRLNGCFVSPDSISAVKPEGDAREIKYIQLTGLDLSGGFVLEGEIMLDWATPHTRFYREAFGMNIDVR